METAANGIQTRRLAEKPQVAFSWVAMSTRQPASSTTNDAPSIGRSPPSSHWLITVAGVAILGGAIAWVYSRAIPAPFIFDDTASIFENHSIRQLWPLWGGEPNYGPITPDPELPMSARPLVNLSLAINYHFGQLDPSGYRAVHLVVHLLTALLLWSIVGRTLRLDYFRGKYDGIAGRLGFCVALLWAVHPLATETVVYITQRTELMMAFFYLAALDASLRYWASTGARGRVGWLAVAAASSVLGALSKEMIASLPAVVLLFEYTFVSGSFWKAARRSWPLYACLSLCWAVLVAINIDGPRTPAAGFGMGASATEWWFTQSKVLFLYLKLAVWPWPLRSHYGMPYLQTFAEAWPWLIGVAVICLASTWLVWRRAGAGFVLVTVLAILSPTLLVPLPGETAVERRMYLPLAALVALAVVSGYAMLEKVAPRWARHLELATASALAVVLSVVSVHRLAAYETELILWQDAFLHEPDSSLININLGVQLNKAGRTEEGLQRLLHAVQVDPDWFLGHYNLARAYEDAGQTDEALHEYEQALRAKSNHVASHNNLGRILSDQGKYPEAIAHFEEALRYKPSFSAAHNNFGTAYIQLGNLPQAIHHFEEALRLQPTIEGYTNLATAYAMAGRPEDAIATAEKGAQLAHSQDQETLARQIEAGIEAFRRRSAP